MNRKKIALKLTAALLCWLVYGTTFAEGPKKDAGPTAKETVEFVNGLLACEIFTDRQPSNKNITFWEWQVSTLELEERNLLLTEKVDARISGWAKDMDQDRGPDHTSRVVLTPKDLEPEVVVTGEKNVKLSCNPNMGACIQRTETRGSGVKEEKSYTDYYLNFCDADKAQRAARAMKHLIEISGGKKSLF